MNDAGERERSALRTYQDMVVGQRGWWPLVRFELITSLLASFPGAAGIVLRGRLYRRLLGAMGRGTVIGRSVTLRGPGRIHLGRSVILDDYVDLSVRGDDASLRVGDRTFIGRGTSVHARDGTIELGADGSIGTYCRIGTTGSLRIGRHALIAAHCSIGGGNHGMQDLSIPMSRQPALSDGVTIEDDVWLGTHAVVLDGVSIGSGAVVGAGAVVTRDVPPRAIVAGVPARILSYRGKRSVRRANL